MDYDLNTVTDCRYEAYYVCQRPGVPPKIMPIYTKECNIDIYDIELFLNIELRRYIETRWASLVGVNGHDGESVYVFADRIISHIMHDLVKNDMAQMNMGNFFVECVIDKNAEHNMFCVREVSLGD